MRKYTIGLLSGLVLTGAVCYAYRDPSPTALNEQAGRPMSTSTINPDPENEGLRKIIAVDDERLYTGTFPLSKEIPAEDVGGRKVLGMLTPEEATKKLRSMEESYHVGRDQGVWRYDVVQLPSNNPIEDDHAEKIVEVPDLAAEVDGQKTDWMFWGVFDGHGGWTTSAKLRNVLIGYVARELNETFKLAAADPITPYPSQLAVEQAIKNGFVRLDHEIVHQSVERVFKNPSKLIAAEQLAPALSGSCALLAFYEPRSQLLRVACTGDSRAVLGRRTPNGKWIAAALSKDQTGSNKEEEERMNKEHPGEKTIRNGRVLGGLEPTRAFGDAVYKWSKETQLKIKNQFFGRTPNPNLKTPPYVTAEPVVTTTKIEPSKGDFVVLATDGLWEMLTNDEVVGLVGKWLDKQQGKPAAGSRGLFNFIGGSDSSDTALPVESGTIDGESKTPIRVKQWGIEEAKQERFVFEDKNAATHLIRNALGGKNDDVVCALLTLPYPYSRRYRDDLTVEVIFFGESKEKSDKVTTNHEATTPKKDDLTNVKSKL